MLRLVKMAVYGLIGYAAYEFVRGMVEGPAQRRQGGGEGRRRRSGSPTRGTAGVMGGSSSPRGQRIATQEADGGSLSEVVGRGVVPQR